MIRLVTIHDTEQILEIYAPYVQGTPISFETIVPSKVEMETRIKHVLMNNPWIIIEDGNNILGYALLQSIVNELLINGQLTLLSM